MAESAPDPPTGSDNGSSSEHEADDGFDDLLQAAVRPLDTTGLDPQQSLQFMRLPTGTIVSDRFIVEWCVGTGGMGDVYRCEDLETKGAAALKVIRRVDDHSRFKREATILSALSHEAIVRYLGHGSTITGTPYLAMEWLDGEDLARVLERSQLSIADSLNLARRVCEALALAHRHGFIHRDIKPSNLFITHGRVEETKVLDFGVAHQPVTTQTLTRAGTMLGTVGYMAPEQAWGIPSPDPRDDLFSLGCVLFECLTGRPAFAGESSVAVLEALLQVEPPDVRSFNAGIPAALSELVQRLLRKARKDRPSTADEVVRALSVLEDPSADERVDAPALTSPCPPSLAILIVARGANAEAAGEAELAALDAVAGQAYAMLISTDANTRVYALATTPELALVDVAERAMECALALQRARPGLAIQVSVLSHNIAGIPLDELTLRLPDRARAAPATSGVISTDAAVAALVQARYDPARRAFPKSVRIEGDQAVASGDLVGREAEFAILSAAFDECRNDDVCIGLLLSGPPGIGKSRLVAEFLSTIELQHETHVIAARASYLERETPSSLLRALSRTTMVAGLRDVAREFHATLEHSCSQSAAIVWIDDAQWTDVESLRAITVSASQLAERPLLVIVAARSDLPHELRALWTSIGAHDLVLRPLGVRAAGQYARATFRTTQPVSGLVALAVGLADGNPRLLHALLAADDMQAGAAFDTAVALAMEHLSMLPRGQRDVLAAASVFVEQIWLSGLRAMLGNRPDVERDIDELRRRKLLIDNTPHTHPHEVELGFGHAIVREAAHRSSSIAERLRIRQLAAHWLQRAQRDAASMRLRD
jgi:eukaryotic-like serine/threonine-protein kinase